MKTPKNKFNIGDIFCIKLDNNEYAFGRCISEISPGHIVEIFNYFSNDIDYDINTTEERLFEPIIIDTWSLFGAREKEGQWKKIGHDKNYKPKNINHLRFWGMAGTTVKLTKLKDVFDNDCEEIEIEKIRNLELRIPSKGLHFKIKGEKDYTFLTRAPYGDIKIKDEIEKYRKK